MAGINQLGPKSAFKTKHSTLGGVGSGQQVVAAPTIGGRAFTRKKHRNVDVDAQILKLAIESRLRSLPLIHKSEIVRNDIIKSHDVISFLQKPISFAGKADKNTLRVGNKTQVADGIVEDISKYLDSISLYGKAGIEVTGGLRLAAGISKSIAVDANLVSLQLFKYEVMGDSKDGPTIYNEYVLKKNKNDHRQFVKSNAFELIMGMGVGAKTEVTRELLGPRTDSKVNIIGQTSETQISAAIPFAPILSVFVKPEYDRFKDTYTTKVGVTLSGKFGAFLVGEGGVEVGVNIRH